MPKGEAVVTEGTEIDARLWEIAENLHRADLTSLERSEHIAEWIKLTGERAKAQPAPSDHAGGQLPLKGLLIQVSRQHGIIHACQGLKLVIFLNYQRPELRLNQFLAFIRRQFRPAGFSDVPRRPPVSDEKISGHRFSPRRIFRPNDGEPRAMR
jgi:hypothetical protein